MGLAPDSVDLMGGARTNTSYRVSAARRLYAMRVPGEGTNEYIDRRSEVANLRLASEALDFVPRVFYANGETGLIISEFLEGARSLTMEDAADDGLLAAAAERLAFVHSSGIAFGNVFDLRETKRSYTTLLEAAGVGLPVEVVREKRALDEALAEYAARSKGRLAPCHIDPNMANFMERDGKLFLIDWEYSGMCDPLFDVANMAMTDRFNEATERRFVRCYERAAERAVDRADYLLTKVASDWMWLFWHLIKLEAGQMVDYNEFSWRNRLRRALENLREIG